MTWYFDAHIHLSDPAYAKDMDLILMQMRHLRIKACCVSVSVENSLQTIRIAERDDLVLPFVGIHPEHADDNLEEMTGMIERSHSDIAGIGEIGLDPTYTKDDKEARRQVHVFETLMAYAERFDKPVSIHARKSLDDILEIMTSYDSTHALLHWFDGNKRQLQRAMDMGFFVSYGPVAVYANDKQVLLSRTDKSRILVETDGPVRFSRCFEGKSGQVSFIPSVIFCASKVIGRTFDETAAMLEKNTESFLGI